MDFAFQIASTNGTILHYDNTYFNIEAYQQTFDEIGIQNKTAVNFSSCTNSMSGTFPFGEINH